MGEAAWRTDPLHTHEYRYWDGTGWTGQVADAGQDSWDATGLERLSSVSGSDRVSPVAVESSSTEIDAALVSAVPTTPVHSLIPRDLRIAGVLMMIMSAWGALSFVASSARMGGQAPDATVIWFFFVGAGLGVALLSGARWAGVPAIAFCLALCFGVVIIEFARATEGMFGGIDRRATWEVWSDSGLILASFMVAWYATSSVLRTMRRNAGSGASPPPA